MLVYHRRSLAETVICRFKQLLVGKIRLCNKIRPNVKHNCMSESDYIPRVCLSEAPSIVGGIVAWETIPVEITSRYMAVRTLNYGLLIKVLIIRYQTSKGILMIRRSWV